MRIYKITIFLLFSLYLSCISIPQYQQIGNKIMGSDVVFFLHFNENRNKEIMRMDIKRWFKEI